MNGASIRKILHSSAESVAKKLRSLKSNLRNRYNKTHVMFSKELKRGQWIDFPEKFELCAFDTFQWYVENDLGLDYLEYTWDLDTLEDWEKELYNSQMTTNKEILDIYYWWLNHKFQLLRIQDDMDLIAEKTEHTWTINSNDPNIRLFHDLINEEEKLLEERDEYLHRLVNIRKTVWI